jgi:archaellin
MRYRSYLLLSSLCIIFLLITGCSQPEQSGIPSISIEPEIPSSPVQHTSEQRQYVVAVTAQEVGNNIIIVYQGGTDTDKLLQCAIIVNEIEQSQKLGNTPGETVILEGVGTIASDHVVVVAYFNDGSSQTILDTYMHGGGISTGQGANTADGGGTQTSPSMKFYGPTYGVASEAGGDIEQITFNVGLISGRAPIDFERVTIKISTDKGEETLFPSVPLRKSAPSAGQWSIINVEKDYGASKNLLEEYKVFTISVYPATSISQNSKFIISIIPTQGSELVLERIATSWNRGANVIY